jgi:succinate dehydrogenase / fumarate reductase cytochrome b subunit
MSTATADAAASTKSPSFFRTRLGSALAVVPLGAWTVLHLWNNLAAYRGGKAWQEAVTSYKHSTAQFVTGFLVLAPLLIHTIWGIGRMRQTKVNVGSYGYFSNWKFLLQRLSALGVLGFLGAHIWLAMLHPRLVEGHAEPFADIASEMHHNPPTLIVYALGTLGVSYHLANGLHTFAMAWGVVSSRRALKQLEAAAYATFVVLLAMSWGTVYALWQAGTNL